MGGIELAEVRPIVVPHLSRSVGEGVEGIVVKDHHLPVARRMDVRLDVLIPEVDGALERNHGVLRPQDPAPPMGEPQRMLA